MQRNLKQQHLIQIRYLQLIAQHNMTTKQLYVRSSSVFLLNSKKRNSVDMNLIT